MLNCASSDGWKFSAFKKDGVIFLGEFEIGREKKAQKAKMDEQQKRFTFYGYRFERYVVTDMPPPAPAPAQVCLQWWPY